MSEQTQGEGEVRTRPRPHPFEVARRRYGQTLGRHGAETLVMESWMELDTAERSFVLAKLSYLQLEAQYRLEHHLRLLGGHVRDISETVVPDADGTTPADELGEAPALAAPAPGEEDPTQPLTAPEGEGLAQALAAMPDAEDDTDEGAPGGEHGEGEADEDDDDTTLRLTPGEELP